jgi:hypothetical protein
MGKAVEMAGQESLRIRAGKYAIAAAMICAISALFVISSNDFALLLLPAALLVMKAMKAGGHAKAVLSAAFIICLFVSSAATPYQPKGFMAAGVLSYAFLATLAMASLADLVTAGHGAGQQSAGKSGFGGFCKKQASAVGILR